MGAGTAVIAYDVNFNREVLGSTATFFTSADDVPPLLRAAESDPTAMYREGGLLRDRARDVYRWDASADGYEDLLMRLRDGQSQRGAASGRRRSGVSIPHGAG
jgi:glycosyltransferase involved in cell wall biosynthesis